MKREDDVPENIFIWFKKHVDSRLSAGLSVLLGSGSAVHPARKLQSQSIKQPSTLIMNTSTSQMEPNTQNQQALALLSSTVDEAYNPLALGHLPQPKPSDCPSTYDASVFTFQDAFEDLLAVAQGREMISMDIKYNMRTLLNQMYPKGEPDFLWRLRLQSQGLIPKTTPYQPSGGARTEQDKEFSQLMGHLDRVASHVWKTAREELDKEGAAFWGNVDTAVKSFFKQTPDGLNKELPASWDNSSASVKSLDGDNDSARRSRREPRHFEDLFSAFGSDIADRDKSWDTFMKSITEGPRKKQAAEGTEPKNVTETDDYTDRFGWRHQKNTTRTLDSEGKEIGKETRWTITSRNHNPAELTGVAPLERVGENAAWPEPQTSAKSDTTGEDLRTTETRDEYVDWLGYLHTTTKTKTLDRDGNEVSSSTHITIRPAGQAKEEPTTNDSERDGEQRIGDGEKIYNDHGKVHKNGWFWK